MGDQKLISRAPPRFGRHVKPLVPAASAVVGTHQSALGPRGGFVSHLETLLTTISSPTIKRNHCHGTLLQLTKLLAETPANLVVEHEEKLRIRRGISHSYWILEQATRKMPCYPITDQYVKMVNLIVWRLPSLIDEEMLETIREYLDSILFAKDIPPITIGREICLANIAYLYIIILSKRCYFQKYSTEQHIHSISTENTVRESMNHPCQLNKCTHTKDIMKFIHKGLTHKSYEVVLTCLNYLLILYKKLEIECHFQKHLSSIAINENVLKVLRKNQTFSKELCKVLEGSKYMECIQKTLSVLSLGDGTQKYVVELKIGRKPKCDDEIAAKLLDCIRDEHENLTHVYLESLRRFVKCSLQSNPKCSLSDDVILEVVRMIFDCCTSENNDSTREVAATFLQDNFEVLIEMKFESLSEEQKCKHKI
ncbi:hypothetical protein evm_003526 [Chilo suppressalis]|nr:hypothetical protein evm_003526 [Chilo suppressalis]